MKLTQLEINRVDDEIALSDGDNEIFITADMVDLVCSELQKLKKEIKNKEDK